MENQNLASHYFRSIQDEVVQLLEERLEQVQLAAPT